MLKRPLTMRAIFDVLTADRFGKMTASDMYRKLNAHRDRETWRYLIGEIYGNRNAGDKDAPVTCRGTGKRGDAIFLEISGEWDPARDWDAEHGLGLRVNPSENPRQHPF